MLPSTPSTSTPAVSPTFTEVTWELDSVPVTSKDSVPMMTTKMEFSYKDGSDFVFTDPDTFESVTLAAELVGDAKDYLVENATVTVTFVEEKAVSRRPAK